VILCGYKGEKIKEVVERDLTKDCREKLQIEYAMVGDAWRQGTAYSVLEAKRSFAESSKFLLCMADHIFDPALIDGLCDSPPKSGEASCLVETDFKGMVGMPSTSVKVQLAEDGGAKVSSISRTIDLKEAHGVDAGLFVCEGGARLCRCRRPAADGNGRGGQKLAEKRGLRSGRQQHPSLYQR
jgi:choline kinase